jgi:hypothetical protein
VWLKWYSAYLTAQDLEFKPQYHEKEKTPQIIFLTVLEKSRSLD